MFHVAQALHQETTMGKTRKNIADKEFHDRLEALRSQIESIPEQFRESLRAEADKVEERHKRLAVELGLE